MRYGWAWGTTLALAYGMIFDGNSVRAIKIFLIVGLVDCVIGLKSVN
ncbi:multidrug transporter EmrE-like cation transporter [Paeniglutamicibacter kerguelensis]|uniref:Multidrug transporter EmrE-like cation transporter n=1 Tax=Paeniglutamicibacter kerguelensis TaxID=254788 RepID=A0ABS4XIH0_9MICC|nr:multidrug transporter EmrE-like cation transporter [Paeniglutamicibacter kerguelensis]